MSNKEVVLAAERVPEAGDSAGFRKKNDKKKFKVWDNPNNLTMLDFSMPKSMKMIRLEAYTKTKGKYIYSINSSGNLHKGDISSDVEDGQYLSETLTKGRHHVVYVSTDKDLKFHNTFCEVTDGGNIPKFAVASDITDTCWNGYFFGDTILVKVPSTNLYRENVHNIFQFSATPDDEGLEKGIKEQSLHFMRRHGNSGCYVLMAITPQNRTRQSIAEKLDLKKANLRDDKYHIYLDIPDLSSDLPRPESSLSYLTLARDIAEDDISEEKLNAINAFQVLNARAAKLRESDTFSKLFEPLIFTIQMDDLPIEIKSRDFFIRDGEYLSFIGFRGQLIYYLRELGAVPCSRGEPKRRELTSDMRGKALSAFAMFCLHHVLDNSEFVDVIAEECSKEELLGQSGVWLISDNQWSKIKELQCSGTYAAQIEGLDLWVMIAVGPARSIFTGPRRLGDPLISGMDFAVILAAHMVLIGHESIEAFGYKVSQLEANKRKAINSNRSPMLMLNGPPTPSSSGPLVRK